MTVLSGFVTLARWTRMAGDWRSIEPGVGWMIRIENRPALPKIAAINLKPFGSNCVFHGNTFDEPD